MVPSHFVLLEKMPLSANGKLDRRALPKPDLSQAQAAYVAPGNALESQLAAIWADVLKLENVGVTDNFFELGGDSIISIQVVSRARQAGIVFTPKDLFQRQTVQGIVQVASRASAVRIEQGPVTGETPLLPIQHWFFDSEIPERHHWNQSVLLKPLQALDTTQLEGALHALVAHHDALRLSFVEGRAHLRDVQASELLWVRELNALDQLDALTHEAQRSLDLHHGPLLRALLVKLPEGEQRLLLVIHHLAVDGVSWRILLEDLQAAYNGKALAAKTHSIKVWAEHLHAFAGTPALQQQLGWWQAQLQGVSDTLPLDHADGGRQHKHEARVRTQLNGELTRQLLQDAPAAYRTRINDLLLTALARVIGRWTGRADTLVRLEGHGREDLFDGLDTTRTVGWFTSLFPVKLTPAAALGDSIKAIKEQLRAVPNNGLGYGVLRYLGSDAAQRSLAALAQGEIVFNYLGQLDGALADDGALFAAAGEGSGQGQSPDAPLSSLLAINGQVLGGELELTWSFSRELFDLRTVQTLADAYGEELRQLIAHCVAAGVAGVTPSDFPLAGLDQAQLDSLPLAPAQIADVYPLSPMQQGMLFHSLYEQEGASYVNQMLAEVRGLDVERFRAAWQAVVDNHDVLRANFVSSLAQPLQVIRRQMDVAFVELDWRQQDCSAPALAAWAEADQQRGFDLQHDPLLRLSLLRTGADTHYLVFTSHHILLDGWSNSRMLGEVLQRYSGQVPPAGKRYRDYIEWLQRQDAKAGQDFWQGQLAGLDEPTRLVPLFKAPAEGEGFAERLLTLGSESTRRLNDFARDQRVTANTLLQAAWMLVLQRHSGQSGVTFGATVAGRPADLPGVEEQLGLFINTLPVVGRPRVEQSVAEWVQQVQAQNLALREFEHTPLYDIQRWAGWQGEALFDSIMVFENYPIADALKGAAPQALVFDKVVSQEQTHYPLTLVIEAGAELAVRMSYDRSQLAGDTVAQLAAHFEHLLMALIADPQAALGELSMLSDAERQHVLRDWNATEAEFPSEACIQSLIEAQVELTPDAPALVFAGEELSYAEVNRRANQLAHKLRELGVGPDALVGISVERSLEMVIGLVAIIKAGGAYVPLDPDYPQDRLAYMIEDSGVQLLLTQSSLVERLPIPAGVQALSLDQLDLSGYSDENPSLHTVPENLAYVIYTSGSTGKPKGAGNSHRALVNRLHWMQKAYGLDGSDTVLQKTPFSFDVSVWEFFWPLLTGARLAVALPGDHRDPERLVATINQYGVSTLHFVPSMLQAFMTSDQVESCLSLKRIVCSGEALPAELAAQTLKRLPQSGLYNLYGPTEAAIDVTHWTCTLDDHLSVPIGQPIDNLKTHILEDGLLPAAPGTAAELYLGGVGLARGYHNRPSLTAERFVPDPFSDNGGRLYRTGDLARYRDEGVIEYSGRIDHQVKIRGLRIELGEIEARLLEHPAVREASVIDIDGPSGKQLAAYLVADDSAELKDALKAHLKVHLPEFMVPSHFVLLEKMPLSANGKLDRRALPKPDLSQAQAAYVAPGNALESQLAAIWADVLKLEKVGITDNFFELGGDSIISIQVVSRARQAGIVFTPKDLFQRQTVRGIAQVASRASAVQAEQGLVTGEAPLTPIQRWFFDSDIPQPQQWNQALMLAPREPLDAGRLEAAVQALLIQHDVLRARFDRNGARFQAQTDAPLWLRELSDREQLTELATQAQRSLDLENGPLLRVVLANLPQGEQRLLLVIHHLVVDGVSWRILLEDLQAAYNGAALPRKTSSFKQWAARVQQHAASPALEAQLAWWQAQLQGVSDALPTDRANGSQQQCHARSVHSRLDRELTRQLLQDAPAAYRTQINDLLLTALARVVSRWTGRAETLVRLEGHGREALFDDLDITRTVGWFTSMFPVKLVPAADLDASIKAIKEQLRAVPDKGLGYGMLRHLGSDAAQRSLAELARGEIVFNYLGQFDAGVSDGLLLPATESTGEGVSPLAPLGSLLSIDGQVSGGELSLGWTFSGEVFDTATIQRLADDYASELARLIAHCVSADAGGVTPSDLPLAGLSQLQLDQFPLAAAEIADLYPLSPMQQGMLFHSLFEEEGASYINQLRTEVRGLDVERFRAAWQAVVDRHDVLRANFVSSFGEPLQVIRKQRAVPFEVQDWRGRADLEAAVAAWAEADQQRGFDLEHDALLRLTLLRTAEDTWQLVYTSHHILLDGWSSSRLLGEVLMHYRGEAVAAPGGRYGDYIHWLQQQDGEAAQQFWTAQLAELDEPTRLAPLFKAPAQGEGFADRLLTLDSERTRRLNDFARDQRVTANTLLQAAWMLVLQRCTGQSGVTFGATVAGRPADLPGVEEQLGLFINTLPVVGRPRIEQTVAEWVQQVQARNLALREFEHTPLYEVQRWAGWSGEALFDSIMVFENYPIADALQQASPQSLVFDRVVAQEQTHYPLTLVIEAGEQLAVRMSYDRSQLAGDTVAQLAAHFEHLLMALITDPQTALGELSMLSEADQHHVLRDWNATEAEFPSEACIQSLIEAQVTLTPDAPALVFAGEELSYAEVNRRANQLAHKVRELGVGPDALVGISVQRSLEMVIGLVAIIKAGGAYVPLDPDYPQDRLAYMIEDSGVQLLLTQSSLVERLPIPAGVQALSLDQLDLSGYSEANPSLHTVPENLAYVIYTSGSTGKPKGAGNSHRALVNRLHWMQKAYGLDGSDTVLQKTPFSFDVSVWEFFWPLLTGARLAVALPGDHRDPERLVATINQYGVSTLHFVPSMLQAFMTSELVESCTSLKRVVCSGEALPAELAAQTLKRLPQSGLYNLYGPTEAAIDVTHWTCTLDDHLSVPIGQPIDNLKTHILEDGLLPAAPGTAAELYLGGVGLARGYHNRPSLTAERFVPDPFSDNGGRLYRTGDLARYRDEGVIEYSGRIDHQVKIRGLRIELGEIEARLLEHPAVREASVIDIDGPSGKQLAAYLVADDSSELKDALKAHLKVHLPEFMVPSHFVLLEKMPLSANGKLDRRALPKPDVSQARQAYVAPSTELEQQLAAIWAEVLTLEQVGMTDDFFELGGHSLLATQIVSRVQKELGHHVPLRAMFELNTLQALAQYIVGQADTRIDDAKVDRLSDLMAELEAL